MAVKITQLFAPTLLTGSAVTIYTVPASPVGIVLVRGRVRFTNQDTGLHTVTAYAIQAGGTASAANCFANAVSIAPGTYLDMDIPVLAAGGFIQALTDTASDVSIQSMDGVLFA